MIRQRTKKEVCFIVYCISCFNLSLLTLLLVSTGHVHRYKPDTPICSDFILGKCKKGFKCSGHHCPLPYHWQYRVEEADVWKSFSETDNEKLEKLYCDVMLEEYSATSFQISFERQVVVSL